jgi:hypothetical protein
LTLIATSPSPYWYLTRGSGAVALILLTAALVLGVVDVTRWRSERWPRFVVDGLHRSLSLLALAFLAVHIVTSVLDSFAPLALKDAIVPFVSAYRPVWVGLGALAFDVLLAVAVTSLVRHRLGHRAWRVIHWVAYTSWPLAILHSLGTGSDAKQPWLLILTLLCLVPLVAAVGWRIASGWPRQEQLRVIAGFGVVVSPILLLVWFIGGPLASNWAARSGTPTQLLAAVRPVTIAPSSSASSSFHFPLVERVNGTLGQSELSGAGLAEVDLKMNMSGRDHGSVDVRLIGEPLEGGGIAMTESAVSLGPPIQPRLFGGKIVSLNGTKIRASVADAKGRSVQLMLDLSIDPAHETVSGTLRSQGSPSGRGA